VPTKTRAIILFLEAKTLPDLANLYSHDMECQVNVAQDGGERTEGDYKGKKWHGWTDGLSTWKSFRIPYNANREPEYTDSEMNFDLEEHVEAIGMTGWDWKNRVSKWVAFDFDAMMGHASSSSNKKLTNEELDKIVSSLQNIDWVTIRKSTSGSGLHIYVFLDNIPTANHNEHAALARSILGKLSALTGMDFNSKVDMCGGNMWVWHRKLASCPEGFTILKAGSSLGEISPNWRDHLPVITGTRRKNLPQEILESGKEDSFEEMCGQRPTVPLDNEHKKLINYLKESNALWWWDQDHNMLVTHTVHLKKAHVKLGFKGFFDTSSPATNLNEQNCFLHPMRKGAWSIRRYTQGVEEHRSWDQDGQGWTRCYFNKEADFGTACRSYEGLEDPKGGFMFKTAEIAGKAALLMGIKLDFGNLVSGRETHLKVHKDGRIIAYVTKKDQDTSDEMQGWLPKKDKWSKLFMAQTSINSEPEVSNYDDLVRHLISETNEDCGWMIKSGLIWQAEPLNHIRVALGSLGLTPKEQTAVLGSSIFRCWKIVNKPFQPEYPGNRQWNRRAAQLRFVPSQNEDLHYNSWIKILEHCGKGLDDAVRSNGWCKANGIIKGSDYLKCWIASLLQFPTEPLPFLFLYGPQNSGKSIFHEAISLLLTKGYARADAALMNQQGFNGELAGAILGVVEETDLRKNKTAYNRIKDWVTSRDFLIHPKGETPYHQSPNTLHFIQCANDYQSCPIFSGDSRITMSYVDTLDPMELIPKRVLIDLLEKEAPDFLGSVLKLEIPKSNDRLNIPCLETDDKTAAQQLNQTELEVFISEKCTHTLGQELLFARFYERFIEYLDPNEAHNWSKIRVGKELPPQFPRARKSCDGQMHIGNIMWRGAEIDEDAPSRYIIKDGYLIGAPE